MEEIFFLNFFWFKQWIIRLDDGPFVLLARRKIVLFLQVLFNVLLVIYNKYLYEPKFVMGLFQNIKLLFAKKFLDCHFIKKRKCNVLNILFPSYIYPKPIMKFWSQVYIQFVYPLIAVFISKCFWFFAFFCSLNNLKYLFLSLSVGVCFLPLFVAAV